MPNYKDNRHVKIKEIAFDLYTQYDDDGKRIYKHREIIEELDKQGHKLALVTLRKWIKEDEWEERFIEKRAQDYNNIPQKPEIGQHHSDTFDRFYKSKMNAFALQIEMDNLRKLQIRCTLLWKIGKDNREKIDLINPSFRFFPVNVGGESVQLELTDEVLKANALTDREVNILGKAIDDRLSNHLKMELASESEESSILAVLQLLIDKPELINQDGFIESYEDEIKRIAND